MPPRLRIRLSANRSDKSVIVQMLTAMMPSCPARSSLIASPNKPKPALLTTNSTSTPSAARASAILSPASGCSRSQGIMIGAAPPLATISFAKVDRRSARRATSTTRWPFDAKTRASSVPIPAEAPVISVTRSVTISALLIELRDMPPTLTTRAYALGGMQAIRKHIGAVGPTVLWQRIAIFSGLIATRAQPSRGTLKFRHVRYRTVEGSSRLDRTVSQCRVSNICIIGRRHGWRGGDTALEINPIARRHAQEIGGAPDHVVLELADLAVGIDKLPHHFDDAKPALLIHRAHDDAGEMIEIDRLTLDQHRGGDQLICRAGIKPETGLEQTVKFALFNFGRLAVERDHVNQQGRCRQTISGIVKGPILVRRGRHNVGNELA